MPRKYALSPARLVDLAREQGWRVRRGRRGWMLYPADPQAPPISLHETPSDYRGQRNIVHHLRNRGLEVD